jgi:hypothetical protein
MTRYVISIILVLVVAAMTKAQEQQPAPAPYQTMAPVEQYMIANRDQEIALARTAAPSSISANAGVMVLGSHGYEVAVEGKNGFVCFVERSWTASFSDPEFWNPKLRSPNCFNPPAARSVLPRYVKRSQWVMAGATKEQVIEKSRAAVADHSFQSPEPGSFSFMLSKDGYVSDAAAGPWLPHVMFFVPFGQAQAWGAGLTGSPVIGQDNSDIEITILNIPVRRWSDGSPGPPPAPLPTHA